MRIAVLGAKGFVGRNLARHLISNHHVTPVTRDILDMLNPNAVTMFLKEGQFDVVINCAAIMTNDELLNDARNNLSIFMNFYNNRELFGKFINTASGAEFDRSTNIDCAIESDIFNHMPKDSYGWGQNIKARLSAKTDNFYNIRIFNCFGYGELETRLFSRFLKQRYLEISNDRYFDYFSINDLCKVVDYYIKQTLPISDVKAVYENKIKISEALELFCKVCNIEPTFKVISTSFNNYTGSSSRLKTLGIELDGLEKGFEDYI